MSLINRKLSFICFRLLMIGIFGLLTTESHAIVYGGLGGGFSQQRFETAGNNHSYPLMGKIGIKAADIFIEFQPIYFLGYRSASHALAYPGVVGIQWFQFFFIKGMFGGIWVDPKLGPSDHDLFWGGGIGVRAPAPGMAIVFEANIAVVDELDYMYMFMGLIGLEFAF